MAVSSCCTASGSLPRRSERVSWRCSQQHKAQPEALATTACMWLPCPSCNRNSGWAPPPTPRCCPGRQHRRQAPTASASQRQHRDPASYSSMDELRQELEREGSTGLVAGLVNWLGDAANAARGSASPFQVACQRLKSSYPSRRTGDKAISDSSFDVDDSDLDPLAVQQVQAILMGSRASVVKLIRRCPQLLEIERQDLIVRLVGMKMLFPKSDVARMVELAPDAFLDRPWPSKAQQLEAASRLLQQELEGADLDCMFSEDPMILFEPLESLQVGLRRLHELWPGLTPAALADSEPLHLSLVIKVLGLYGPPKGL